MYGTVYVTVHDTVHIDGSMAWHWPMMWHWLMRCHDLVRLKFLCTVDGDVAAYLWTKNLAYGTCITQDYFQPNRVTVQSWVKPCYCSNSVVKPRTVNWWRGAILSIQNIFNLMAMIYSIYKKGASPPNLISLNLFLGSIFYNSFSILYFLCILINSHFALSSIMSG